nr:unnamed protein product [Spirometra erinaceieuropaei]
MRLQVSPANWEDLDRERPTWRTTLKTGTTIYKANRIIAAKTKREVRKSQMRPPRNTNAQPSPTCPRCQRTFRALIGLVGHPRTNCSARTTPAAVSAPTPTTDTDGAPESPPPSSSSSIASTSATAAPRAFTSHIGLVSHLRIRPPKTGEPVPGASIYTRRFRLHCPRTFTPHIGLFSHMRIREGGIDRSLDTPGTSCTSTMPCSIRTPPASMPTTIKSAAASTSCAPTMPSPTHTPSPSLSTTSISTTVNISETNTDTAEISCPHSPPTFTAHIGLVGHLRIHRTETSEPVHEAPTYARRIRLSCPRCTHTFIHCMAQLGHMCIHENLRQTIAG